MKKLIILMGILFSVTAGAYCETVQVQDCTGCPFRFVTVCPQDTSGPSAPLNTQAPPQQQPPYNPYLYRR